MERPTPERASDQLPDQYVITPGLDAAVARREPFLQRLEKVCAPGGLILLRAPALPAAEYADLAGDVIRVTNAADCKLMLHDRPRLAFRLRAFGVHFSQRAAQSVHWGKDPSSLYFAVSCHSLEEVRNAERSGADFCVLGSVFGTETHPCRQPLGMRRFAEIVRAARIPVYAIGGMALSDAAVCRRIGAQGIAGIRCFWGGCDETLRKRDLSGVVRS